MRADHPDDLSPHERLSEIAAILAVGILRLRQNCAESVALEDCAALKRVTDFVRSVATASSEDSSTLFLGEDIAVSTIEESDQSRFDWGWGPVDFFHPDFEHINKCAYFDYQRQRVYVRTNKALKRRLARRNKKRNLDLNISKHITLKQRKCPACKKSSVVQITAKEKRTPCPVPRTKRAYDLVFTPSSVRRQVFGFHTSVHQCTACGEEFIPEKHVRLDRHSHGLKSFVIYLHVTHRMSLQTTGKIVGELFNVHLPPPDLHMIKGLMARYYGHAYQRIRKRLVLGSLIHVDETEVHVRTEGGYVWVFTNMEEVLYLYRANRQGAFLREFLQ